MCRLAQATYRTPSTAATGVEDTSPSAATFQGFACSPAPDQTSPLATFLHHLSHATYEAASESGTAAATKPASAAPAVDPQPASTPKEGSHEGQSPTADAISPEVQQNDSTPYQDFMKFLTQATYHSPGTKPDALTKQASAGPSTGAFVGHKEKHDPQSSSPDLPAKRLTVRTGRRSPAAATPCKGTGILSPVEHVASMQDGYSSFS